MAKQLLNNKKVKYKIIDVTNNKRLRKELISKSNGLKTVPQIFIDQKHIGGYDDLNTLNIQNKLDNIIKKYYI